jgi:hypothetical protein
MPLSLRLLSVLTRPLHCCGCLAALDLLHLPGEEQKVCGEKSASEFLMYLLLSEVLGTQFYALSDILPILFGIQRRQDRSGKMRHGRQEPGIQR